MREVAELPVIRWIAQRFRAKPQPTVETPLLISPPQEPAVIEPVVPIKSPVVPHLSREERRARKKTEYEEWKAAERQTNVTPPSQASAASAEIVTPSVTEVKPAFNQSLLLTRDQIPWLEQPDVRIPLELMTLEGTSGERFLYADFIHGRKLTEAANHLVKQLGVDIDTLTLTHLTPEFLKTGRHPFIKLIHAPMTDKPIYCMYRNSGSRVYIMRRDAIQGLPVIIRIAACDKERQIQVITTISDRTEKRAKKGGKN